MPRIFFCLATANLLVLAGAAVLGWIGLAPAPQRHIVLAVFSLLLSCFIQVLAFTYLTVTGKMIAQMVHLGSLSPGYIGQSKRFKAAYTRSLGMLILTMLFAVATGALRWRGEGGSVTHTAAALLTLGAHALAFFRQYVIIVGNRVFFDSTTQAYNAYRKRLTQARFVEGS